MPLAAVTMVYNDPVFLPIWVRYYGQQLGLENLFVLDHGSTPPALEMLPPEVNRLRVPRGLKSELQRAKFASDITRGLLHYFDGVIYGDCDELIVPDPERHDDLTAFWRDAAPAAEPVLAPIGVELFQAEGRDAPIDLTQPISAQRRYGRFRSLWCKPVVLRRPVRWTAGAHYSNAKPRFTPDAIMFHLKTIDCRISLDRLAMTRNFALAPKDIAAGLSKHQQTTDEEHLAQYYREPSAQLDRDGAGPWEFTAELAKLEVESVFWLNAWRHGDWRGTVVQVPDRFVGAF